MGRTSGPALPTRLKPSLTHKAWKKEIVSPQVSTVHSLSNTACWLLFPYFSCSLSPSLSVLKLSCNAAQPGRGAVEISSQDKSYLPVPCGFSFELSQTAWTTNDFSWRPASCPQGRGLVHISSFEHRGQVHRRYSSK